jgi:hypothetical protein
MRRLFIGWTIVMALWLCSKPVSAQNLAEFAVQMTDFYLTASPDSFAEFQRNAATLVDDMKGTGADEITTIMIAKVSQVHGWPIADEPFKRRVLELLEGKSSWAKFVSDDSQVDEHKIQYWWAAFYATGDEAYLERAFPYAGLGLARSDRQHVVESEVSTLFLNSCRHDVKVVEFVRRKLRTQALTETQARFTKECVSYAHR